MARIAGINIPPHKHAEIGLTAIFGIGRTRARKICEACGIDYTKKIKDLSDAELEKVRDQVNALPNAKRVHRNLQLKLVGAATVVEPDGSGRLLLPASHRNAAAIEKKAVLLGMGGKFELWSEQAHLAQIRQTIGEDEISEDMLDLRL